jgi:predicted secreted protein
MSVRSVFGARVVAIASLAAVLALAGCSGSAGMAPAGAATAAGSPTAAPAATNRPEASAVVPVVADLPTAASQLTVSCDAFATKPKGSADVHLKAGDVMAVTLCTNASTGFSWEQPIIAGDAIRVSGVSTGMPSSAATAGKTLPPVGAANPASSVAGVNSTTLVEQGPSNAVGAATTTTFLITAQHAGTTTVHLSYSRPWAGGEKGVWEYTLNVTID